MKIEQQYLPKFLQIEAEAREKSIPLETKQEYLSRMYWKFRKYASKCNKNEQENIKRAWKMGQFFEKQR